MKEMFQPLIAWLLKMWDRYERPLRIGTLATGFIFDLIIADRPDSIPNNLLLLFYLILGAAIIATLSRRSSRAVETEAKPILLLLALQFCFGGLSSNLLILYGRSGTPAGDLLFTALLAGIVIGNEFLHSRYAQLRFNVGVYYLLLLSYCLIAVPTFILHAVGPGAFLASGAVSLVIIAGFLLTLSAIARPFHGKVGERRLIETGITVGGIFLFFNLLYFGNVIPPVPLVLKDIGVYHAVARADGDSYTARFEPAPWWNFWRTTNGEFNAPRGSNAYCFSSVFAPSGLSTPIRHRWQVYSEEAKEWDTVSEVVFPISGGREGGYRGFSVKSITAAGAWRCRVETTGGQTIGERTFTAVFSSTTPPLSRRTL